MIHFRLLNLTQCLKEPCQNSQLHAKIMREDVRNRLVTKKWMNTEGFVNTQCLFARISVVSRRFYKKISQSMKKLVNLKFIVVRNVME